MPSPSPLHRRLPRSLGVLALCLGGTLAIAASETWPLSDPGDYEYEADEISVDGGVAHLVGSLAGTGADGDLTVTAKTWNLSTDASTGRTVADGKAWPVSASLTSGGSSVPLDGYTSGLAVGDELLIIDVQGSTSDHDSVGSWEMVRVLSVSGSTAITTDLSNAYDGSAHTVIAQRVPNYADGQRV